MERCGYYNVCGYICVDESNNLIYCCKNCNSFFTDVVAFKNHYTPNCRTTLANLDEKCLDNILKFVTSNDLAAFSLTCSTYKMLAERFFDLHCKTGPITICGSFNITKDGIKFNGIKFEVSSIYEQHFHSLIHHVIVSPSLSPDNDVYEFIRDRCSKRLLSLEFTGCSEDEEIMNSAIIEDQLNNLENLRINYMPYFNIYKNLLQYCHRLRSLIIDTAFLDIQWDNAWTKEIYLELETLQMYTDDKNADLTTFFQLNPNVETVCCFGNAIIKNICRLESRRLQRVMMIFQSFEKFDKVKDDVKVFCRRNSLQKFELAFPDVKFSMEEIRTVIESPNITAFHCNDKAIIQLIEQKYTSSKIDKLCIYDRYRSLKNNITQGIEKCFPNLCELRLFMCEKYFPLASIFIQFRKLKQLYLGIYCEVENKLRYSTNDIIQWNNARSQVNNASKLIIHLPAAIFDEFNVQIIEKELIVVKPLIEEYCECLAATEFDHRRGVGFPDIDNAWSDSSEESETS